MVKCERTYPAPASLAKRVSYNSPDVIKCLKEIFHGKCYICEMQDLQDGIVEHLMPHKDKDMELKFGWDNLFWSCNHCNSLKNRAEYEGNIIDCCKTDPERYVKNIYDPYSSAVSVRAKDSQQSSRMTAQLIEESFNRDNTGIRTNAMGQRMMALREEWYRFQKILKNIGKIIVLIIKTKLPPVSAGRQHLRHSKESIYATIIVSIRICKNLCHCNQLSKGHHHGRT